VKCFSDDQNSVAFGSQVKVVSTSILRGHGNSLKFSNLEGAGPTNFGIGMYVLYAKSERVDSLRQKIAINNNFAKRQVSAAEEH